MAILPVTRSDAMDGALIDLAREVEEDVSRQGASAISPERGRELFEARHSREAPADGADVLDRLAQYRTALLDAIGNGRSPTDALRDLDQVLEAGSAVVEVLNRDERSAKRFFGACLVSVQALSEMGREVEARARAKQCVARSPGIVLPADDRTFPDGVRALVADATAEIARESAPVLVESDPAGCSVLFNGRRLGTTPHRQSGLARETYRVQVECEGSADAGRVHDLTPGGSPISLHVDAGLEAVVRTDRGRLRFVAANVSDSELKNRVRAVQSVLGATAVLVLSRPEPGVLVLRRFGVGDVAVVQLAEEPSQDALGRALSQLMAPVRAGMPVSDSETAPSRAAERMPRASFTRVLASGFVAGGLALTGLSFWRFGQQHDRGLSYLGTNSSDEAYRPRGNAWAEARVSPYLFGSTGAALSASGALLLSMTRSREALPWWVPMVSGAVGVGVAGLGIAQLARGGTCDGPARADPRLCVNERDQRDLGALLLLGSAPALTVFVVETAKAIRGRGDSETKVFLRPQNRGAVFTVRRPL